MDLILTNAQVQTLDQPEIRLVPTILVIEVYMLDLHVPEELWWDGELILKNVLNWEFSLNLLWRRQLFSTWFDGGHALT